VNTKDLYSLQTNLWVD